MAESSSTIPVELDQEYRVKLGKSFTFPKENAFHSIKYDFKPKSVDSSQPGRLKVNGDEVTVFMPVLQAESAEDVAMFKGAGKPCRKECILIINTDTGEAVLEKISNTVNLKGVRDLTKRKKVRSMSPGLQKATPTTQGQKQSTKNTSSVQSSKSSSSKTPKKDTKQAIQTAVEKQQFVPSTASSKGPPNSSSYQSTNLLNLPKPLSPLRSNNPTPEPIPPAKRNKVSVSSNSDDSSSSFTGSDDSDSEMDQSNSSLPTQQFTNAPPTSALPIFPSDQSITNQSTNHNAYNMPFLLHGDREGQGSNALGGAMNTSMLSLSSTSSSGESSTGSSSESESESSDNNEEESVSSQHHPPPPPVPPSAAIQRPRTISVLKKDLELSDSDEDSDL